MTTTAKMDLKDQHLLDALRGILKKILEQDNISAVLAPWKLPAKTIVMPTLLTDAQKIDLADPLSPAFPVNSAKVLSRLTRKPSGGTIAALVRPCEIRAFFELVKLKQGHTEELILISVDCLGAMGNRDYLSWAQGITDKQTLAYVDEVLSAKKSDGDRSPLAHACRTCEFPIAEGADIRVGLFGVDTEREILIQSSTDKGEALIKALDLAPIETPAGRQKEIERRIAERIVLRDSMFAEVGEQIDSLEKVGAYLSSCVNCYNCRVACPVCYCRECVFVTDVFDHEPNQYMRWARRKGAVKMPTDTLLYHVTRLTHMSTACVGCGQCTNACPNDIPVMDLFRTVAHRSQQAFDYQAGRSLDDQPPMSVFKEKEFEEIVGVHD